LQQKPIDPRADIFSYGVAAYELLTNQKPFSGETPSEILAAQMDTSGPASPREHKRTFPPARKGDHEVSLARPGQTLPVHERAGARFGKRAVHLKKWSARDVSDSDPRLQILLHEQQKVRQIGTATVTFRESVSKM